MEHPEPEDNEPFSLHVDEEGVVWLITVVEDGTEIELGLGGKDETCEVLCRFLAELDYGDCR